MQQPGREGLTMKRKRNVQKYKKIYKKTEKQKKWLADIDWNGSFKGNRGRRVLQ